MSDGGDCRTAPATPGLLITYYCARIHNFSYQEAFLGKILSKE